MTNTTYALSDKDSSYYEDGYKIFLQRSDFRERIIEMFSRLVTKKINDKKTLKVLDVGCGNGVMTKKYLTEVKKTVSNIHLSLLEPAQVSLNEAEELLRPEVQKIARIPGLKSNCTFDLIIASYVFYHLSPESLEDIVNQLSINGSLAIMMGTHDHPLKSHPKLQSVTSHGSSDKLNPFLNILLKTEKFKIERHNVDTKLNLNGLWANETFSNEAQRLLGFSLNKNFAELSLTSIEALNEIFGAAKTSDNWSLKSVHEIIWIERIK